MTTYFHPNGQIWKSLPYIKNQLEGTVEVYKNTGELLQLQAYCQGQKHGPSIRYWDGQELACQEEYCTDRACRTANILIKQGFNC